MPPIPTRVRARKETHRLMRRSSYASAMVFRLMKAVTSWVFAVREFGALLAHPAFQIGDQGD